MLFGPTQFLLIELSEVLVRQEQQNFFLSRYSQELRSIYVPGMKCYNLTLAVSAVRVRYSRFS